LNGASAGTTCLFSYMNCEYWGTVPSLHTRALTASILIHRGALDLMMREADCDRMRCSGIIAASLDISGPTLVALINWTAVVNTLCQDKMSSLVNEIFGLWLDHSWSENQQGREDGGGLTPISKRTITSRWWALKSTISRAYLQRKIAMTRWRSPSE
jgi:hypothetical protein